MYNKFLKTKTLKNKTLVISNVDIPAKSPIIEFRGDRVAVVPVATKEHYIQIGLKTFLGPSGDIDDYINHGCIPNCYLHIVGDRAILYSLHLIKAGTELSYDFSLSSTSSLDEWQMECNCGSVNCRRIISGYQYLDETVKSKYTKMGIVPLYISEKPFK